MKTTIGGRFSQLIETLKTNKNAFAHSIGKSHTMVALVIDGKSKPSYDVMEAILTQYPQVNPDWLIIGEGEMFRSRGGEPVVTSDSYLRDLLQKMEENFSRLSTQLQNKDRQIDGLQRTVDALLSNRPSTSEPSFLNGVPFDGRVVALYPAEEKAVA